MQFRCGFQSKNDHVLVNALIIHSLGLWRSDTILNLLHCQRISIFLKYSLIWIQRLLLSYFINFDIVYFSINHEKSDLHCWIQITVHQYTSWLTTWPKNLVRYSHYNTSKGKICDRCQLMIENGIFLL